MRLNIQLLALAVASGTAYHQCHAFSTPSAFTSRATTCTTTSLHMTVEPPPGGMAVEEQDTLEVKSQSTSSGEVVTEMSTPSSSASNKSESATKRVGINSRGAKMNEIDFTLDPTDVSLSRCYQMSKEKISSSASPNDAGGTTAGEDSAQSLSLTRALNTASNRAVRRILLSRSWPSAEALNLSLRTVLMQQKQNEDVANKAGIIQQQQNESQEGEESDKMKCPVPRPILNIFMNRRDEGPGTDESTLPTPRTSEEREQQWITNQIAVFRDSYSSIPGYDQAEAYLESTLCLATSGTESPRVAEVMEGGTYVGAYNRILSVIQSVGVVLEQSEEEGRRRIAKTLIDQDICLSMLDKIALVNEKKQRKAMGGGVKEGNPVAIPYDAAAVLAYESDPANQSVSFEEFKVQYVADTVAMVTEKKRLRDVAKNPVKDEVKEVEQEEKPKGAYERGRKRRLLREKLAFWSRDSRKAEQDAKDVAVEASAGTETEQSSEDVTEIPIVIKPDDLGGVLLSAEEPTMTRQLNVLSNIVQRTLIFGGDQELLVLMETLDADKPAFIQRWYKDNAYENTDIQSETRPGVQYLNSLIQLMRDCYTKGVLQEINPTVPLTTGYLNAYGRLTASLIELGSGYVRPSASSSLSLAMTTTAATAKYLSSNKPKTAREELGRFANWESAVRKNRENPYPDDLVGCWDVRDLVGTEIIGTTEVIFKPQGELSVKPPMQGLRWRLDPGPTHLDTCTFQVLSDDGAILQYKGFVDRGSRLEARVSKRPVSMRGGVSFLMRDPAGTGGSIATDYWDDMVPMQYKQGTTKFIMRNVDGLEDIDYLSGSSSSEQQTAALRCPPVAEGEREILKGPNGPVLVTKVAGTYYAVDATCPHLSLPMKKGKITVENGKPTLTCSFHNSCFEMQTGKCSKWVTGALGNENELIAGIMGGVGSEQKDIVSYQVSEEDDGSLRVTSEAPAVSIAA